MTKNKLLIILAILLIGGLAGASAYYFTRDKIAEETPSIDETLKPRDGREPREPREPRGQLPQTGGSTESYEFRVENPSGSSTLYAKLYLPADSASEALPTVILIPGGSGNSAEFTKPGPKNAQNLADKGFAVAVFDPDGRGKSTGEEDYDGFIQQDGLKAVIESVAELPEVDPDKIGLASFSFGITMASGVLARYPDLPIRFLFDWEGPANRDDTGGCDELKLGHLDDVATCGDETFWAEHEASTFIGDIQVPYWRIQTEADHVQPDYNHTMVMINAALTGGNPAVYLNESQVTKALSTDNLPKMAPDALDGKIMEFIAAHAKELLT